MQGVRRDNNAWRNEPVVGYKVPVLLGHVLPALEYLHQLRGFEMPPSVYEELVYYISVVLRNKARLDVLPGMSATSAPLECQHLKVRQQATSACSLRRPTNTVCATKWASRVPDGHWTLASPAPRTHKERPVGLTVRRP